MAAVVSLPEQRLVLENVSWETYEGLLKDSEAYPATRFTYDKGRLEIMVVSSKHERNNRTISSLIEFLADELDFDIIGFGSTIKHKAHERGFEPDSYFYIQNEARVASKGDLDFTKDLPPDLIIEVDITSPSISRFPIYADFGVGEIWRYEDERVTFFKLEAGEYVEIAESIALPKVTSAALTELMEASKTLKRTAWLKRARLRPNVER
jgi:Uma2 family endonuclease